MKLQDEVYTPIGRWHKQYQQMKVGRHCRLTGLTTASAAAGRAGCLRPCCAATRHSHKLMAARALGRACKPGTA